MIFTNLEKYLYSKECLKQRRQLPKLPPPPPFPPSILPARKVGGIFLDSGFHTVDSGFPGTGFQSLSVRPGFWIPVFRRIADSMSCYSWFSLKQTSIGFRNPDFLKAFFPHNLHSAYHLQSL